MAGGGRRLDSRRVVANHRAMDRPRRDGARHFRGQERRGGQVEVRYRPLDGAATGTEATSRTLNLGFGGAFVLAPRPERPGTRLAISLALPTGKAIAATAEVRWVVDAGDEAARGMGVHFDALGGEQVMALNEYFAAATETADFDEAP